MTFESKIRSEWASLGSSAPPPPNRDRVTPAAESSPAATRSSIVGATQLTEQSSRLMERTSARAPLTAIAASATPTRSADRASRRTLNPQNYGCCLAIISGKDEGLSMRGDGWSRRDKTLMHVDWEDWLSASLQKAGDRCQHAIVHFLLARTERFQCRLRDHEGMIASLHDIQRRGRMHPLPHVLEKVQRTEGIARSLREQDPRLQLLQNLIAQLRSVSSPAKRVAKADHGFDLIDEGDMAAHARAHAFAGEHDRSFVVGAKRGERRTMCVDKLGQRVRPPSALQSIGIIERLDRAD